MNLLQQCAQEFNRLTAYQYHIIVGRKGKLLEFTISFEQADFHHLAGRLTYKQAAQSAYFSAMEPRLKPLAHLEEFLDSNEIIFRYNAKIQKFSVIQADYLLQNDFEEAPVYLFISQRTGRDTYVCRTFFPKAEKDYTEGQPRYTLLKKEKSTSPLGKPLSSMIG